MAESFTNGRSYDGKRLAFSIEDGRFVEVVSDIPGARDIQGATVVPGFIDAHCHVMPTGIDLQRLNLSKCTNVEDVLECVKAWRHKVEPGSWLMAVHYDQTKLPGSQHMHRSQIDAVCPDVPVVLRHFNGHASVVNTAALVAAGVTMDTPNPKGGEYVRDESGELTGVLLERAHERVTDCAPSPTFQERKDAVKRAIAAMLPLGVTTATDMMTGYSDLEEELRAYSEATQEGLPFRLRMFAQWSAVLRPRAIGRAGLSDLTKEFNEERCRLAGIKIFADGAIGSGTAAVYEEFQTGGHGTLIYDPERLKSMVQKAHEEGYVVAIHSIGDRSTDLVLDAYEATGEPQRHRIEHAMILSDAQIERIKRARCHVAMQPEFLYRFGHSYRRQLQSHVFPRLKRVKSCLEAGVPLSFNSDRPIVSGDPWTGIFAAVNRPDGFDPSENVSEAQAVELYTKGGAIANGDDRDLGVIEEGKLADFQIYTEAPVAKEFPKPDEVYVGGHLAFRKGS